MFRNVRSGIAEVMFTCRYGLSADTVAPRIRCTLVHHLDTSTLRNVE
jgi:hypothetical protein